MAKSSADCVETVMGPKPLSELGVTLTHEHLASNFVRSCEKFNYTNIISDEVINLRNFTLNKQYPSTFHTNTCLYDAMGMRTFYYDIYDFKMYGKTIIDNSSHGSLRNFLHLHRICRVTKINVLIGTGFFMPTIKPFDKITLEEFYNIMRCDIEEGYSWELMNVPPYLRPSNKMKAAFIGEVGSDWPISDSVRRSIMATGQLQEQLRCPVSFTPIFEPNATMEVLRIYQEAGGDARKAVISHVDCIFSNKTKFLEFLNDTDCYVEFSLFGLDCSIYPANNYVVLSDAQRIRRIARMKDENLLHRVFISHDIHTKNRLVSFGGHGYAFIMKHIVPFMLQTRNFSRDDINEIMISNPKKWLKRS